MAKVCLIVIDGWGISDNEVGNAIHHANTPVMDQLAKEEYVTLDASGLAVGLPDGLMGNSEVGHMNIGAGRPVYQDIVRINMMSDKKEFSLNKNFISACDKAKSGNGRLHLLGLVSDGGVHAHINHLFSLLEAAKKLEVPKTYVQFFGDGRDTSPTSSVKYVKQLLDFTNDIQYGELATVVGRYYAMDRDNRHERIKIAYEGLVQGAGQKCLPEEVIQVIQGRYDAPEDKRQTDEFLTPIIVNDEGRIRDNDVLIFIDFRADRMRQIVEALGIQQHFETFVVPKNLQIYCMTQYKKEFTFPMLFPPNVPDNVLSQWIAAKQVAQFHCAETEKYAHVTFFFNGGREEAFEKENRMMVPSPKVATYDLKPEMNCAGVADEMINAIKTNQYPFVMCNFAPPDMVGHTGKYEPAIIACEATDTAIGRILEACKENNYTMLVTADHGNAEKMKDANGSPFTAHTTYRVPFSMTGSFKFIKPDHNAALCDVAPTILDIMGFDQPSEMTGKSLIQH